MMKSTEMKAKSIPQHPLLNKSGQKVQFDIQDWGEVATYDYLKAHRHSFHEILVFEKGKAQHDIDFTTFNAKAGHIHFVASDNVHLLVRDKNSKGYSIVFMPDFFDHDLLAQLPFTGTTSPVLQLDHTEFKQFSTIIHLIRSELGNDNTFSDKMLHALAVSLMLLLAKVTSLQHSLQLQNKQSGHIQVFKQLVGLHYKEHYTVEKYAELLHISPKHLIELCKLQTGKTPLKHIQEQVIAEAKRLFYHTKLSVKEVGYELQFDTPAAFSKYFKSVTGYAPSVYRKELR